MKIRWCYTPLPSGRLCIGFTSGNPQWELHGSETEMDYGLSALLHCDDDLNVSVSLSFFKWMFSFVNRSLRDWVIFAYRMAQAGKRTENTNSDCWETWVLIQWSWNYYRYPTIRWIPRVTWEFCLARYYSSEILIVAGLLFRLLFFFRMRIWEWKR